MPALSAYPSRPLTGSAPVERMKMRGRLTEESVKAACRSKGGGSMNLRPSSISTKLCSAVRGRGRGRVRVRGRVGG